MLVESLFCLPTSVELTRSHSTKFSDGSARASIGVVVKSIFTLAHNWDTALFVFKFQINGNFGINALIMLKTDKCPVKFWCVFFSGSRIPLIQVETCILSYNYRNNLPKLRLIKTFLHTHIELFWLASLGLILALCMEAQIRNTNGFRLAPIYTFGYKL